MAICKLNIALLSPSKNAYSETFIQAHKDRLEGNVFYYYGGAEDKFLEGFGRLKNSENLFLYRLQRKFFKKDYTWYLQRFLKSSMKRNKIDIVMVEYGDLAEQNLPVIKELKLPLIVHFHGLDASVHHLIKKHNNYKAIFEYASYIVVVSKKMEQNLLVLGCPRQKLVYNVYGPREDFFNVNPRFSKPQFTAIGRFVDKKAPYYLILAFKKVVEKYPESRLVIAGDGELWNSCKNLIKYYKLENSIKLPGVITKDAYIKYLEESVAMIQHSITAENGDSEGTPVAILEASAAGVPVISTKHAGIPDVIIDGETGLLVSEHDVNGMAEKMMEVLENHKLPQELGTAGKENIKENFSLERHIKVLNGLIANLTHSKN